MLWEDFREIWTDITICPKGTDSDLALEIHEDLGCPGECRLIGRKRLKESQFHIELHIGGSEFTGMAGGHADGICRSTPPQPDLAEVLIF